DVGSRRARKGAEIVAAFERRDDSAAGMFICRFHQLLGYPDEVGFGQLYLAERIIAMSVETGRDQQHIRRGSVERRQDAVEECLAKARAAVERAERRIEDVADTGLGQSAG